MMNVARMRKFPLLIGALGVIVTLTLVYLGDQTQHSSTDDAAFDQGPLVQPEQAVVVATHVSQQRQASRRENTTALRQQAHDSPSPPPPPPLSSSRTRRIALMTLDTSDPHPLRFPTVTNPDKLSLLRSVSLPNLAAYARRHAYAYIEQKESLDASLPFIWTKIIALRRYLVEYDWILYVDADAVIANATIRIEDRIEDESPNDVTLVQDENGLNAGVMLVRHTPWTLAFLDKIIAEHTRSRTQWWQEQHALIHVVSRMRPVEKQIHLHVIPLAQKRWLQSYPRLPGVPKGADYQKGDWIVHFAGEYCADHTLCLQEAQRLAKDALTE